ncbi:hypothetical protein ANN_00118 [Periplaneta americana]|uniref:Uncharacterized protein n=1 Tax=Periplaneta americana TaxID=6978 RepID=A0ABQ8TSP0_PERAM|nr:hypothetical protein ANN_00118 [Periplaneta americana]
MTTQVTTVQPMTGQLSTVIKPQVSIILGYAIERQLAKSHGGWKSNTVAEGSYDLARSMWTSDPRKKSILSHLRTSHNIRDIAPAGTQNRSSFVIFIQQREVGVKMNFSIYISMRRGHRTSEPTPGHPLSHTTKNLHRQPELQPPLECKSARVRCSFPYRFRKWKRRRGPQNRNASLVCITLTVFILPVVLYGCETWTLTLREEQRLKVFENKVLRKIFGAKRDEVTGEWKKLHNAELHALYSSPDIIRNIKSRRLRWAGHVARMGESRNAYRVLVGRSEGKKTFGEAETADKNSIKHTTMRVLLFQTIAPGIPLPPQPVLTRWKTWLNSVNYYAEHYSKIMEIIYALDSTDSSTVAAVKSLPSEQLLEDILFIDSNFKIVSKSIILLESSKLQLSEALNIVCKVSQTVIQNNNSLISEKVK